MRHATHLPVIQLHLNTARVIRRAGQQTFYKATGLRARTLIFFKDNVDFEAGVYVASVLAVHRVGKSERLEFGSNLQSFRNVVSFKSC